MLALLRSRRWQGFTALVIIVIVAFGLLSRWQWSRAEEKRLQQQVQSVSRLQPISPEAGESLGDFTSVTVTGTYLADTRRLVRQRPLEGRNGFWVLEQLATDQGRVWVLRGWIAAEARAQDSPPVPEVAASIVELTGVARTLDPGEPLVDRGGLPPEQVTSIVTAQLPDPGDFTWYLQLRESAPSDPLVPVPLSEPDDLQNVSYAIQWLLFAAVAIGGWFFFLRREARESL